MASNVELLDRLHDIFECKVCSKQFADPIMLPCSHRICRGCLPDLIKNGQDFHCPNCRQKVELKEKGINEFKSDYLIQTIIECLQKSKPFKGTDRTKKCGICSKQSPAAGYCFKCENYLCEICCPDHSSDEKFRDHVYSTVNLSDEILGKMNIFKLTHSRRCKQHPENYLDEICLTCNNLPVCITCRYGDHVGHHAKDLKTKAEENVDRLKDEIEALSEKMEKLYYRIGSAKMLREDVDRFACKREEEIKSSFTEATQALQKECEDRTRMLEARRRKINRGEMNHLGKEECRIRLEGINPALRECEEKYKIQLKGLWQKYSDNMAINEAVNKEKQEKLVSIMEHGWVTERRWRVVTSVLSALIEWGNDWLLVTILPDLSLAIKGINEDIDLTQESMGLEAIQNSLNSNYRMP